MTDTNALMELANQLNHGTDTMTPLVLGLISIFVMAGLWRKFTRRAGVGD